MLYSRSAGTMMMTFLCYLLAINLATFFVYGIDKLKARKGRWRIPERTLLMLAVVGGSIGAWAGMMVWRHKTKHLKFQVGVPLILILQLALLAYVYLGKGATLHV